MQLGFAASSVVPQGENSFAVATKAGTIKTNTLALALRGKGLDVDPHDGFLTVHARDDTLDLPHTLARIAAGEDCILFNDQTNLIFEKYHAYLTRDLLGLDILSSKVDRVSLKHVAENILASCVPDA